MLNNIRDKTEFRSSWQQPSEDIPGGMKSTNYWQCFSQPNAQLYWRPLIYPGVSTALAYLYPNINRDHQQKHQCCLYHNARPEARWKRLRGRCLIKENLKLLVTIHSITFPRKGTLDTRRYFFLRRVSLAKGARVTALCETKSNNQSQRATCHFIAWFYQPWGTMIQAAGTSLHKCQNAINIHKGEQIRRVQKRNKKVQVDPSLHYCYQIQQQTPDGAERLYL